MEHISKFSEKFNYSGLESCVRPLQEILELWVP